MVIPIIQNLCSNYLSSSNVKTDNFVFKLHYQYSVLILVIFGVLATSNQLLLQPIECTSNQKNLNRDFVNAYCWSHPTFVMNNQNSIHFILKDQTDNIPFYGITNSKQESDSKQFNNYYQWVSIVLFIQAFLFYIPRFLWLNYERSIVNYLMLNCESDVLDEDRKQCIALYVIELLYARKCKLTNSSKYYYHILLESMNLAIVLAQFYLIGYFLNMNFNEYGWRVMNFREWSYEFYFDPMSKSFPKMTKCIYYDIGASGSPNRVDYLCVLPYNQINEKIYLFLWFWLQLLIVFNLTNFLYRFLLSFSCELRCRMISMETEVSPNREKLSSIVNSSSIGEWFILNVLSKNLDFKSFNRIVNGIYENSTRNFSNLQTQI